MLRDRDTEGNGSLDERLYATMDYFNGTAIMDDEGVVQERYAYSAFGEHRIMAAGFSPRSTSSYAWEFGFQGPFRDEETGWYNYGYRFYVPLLGRWISRDPIEEAGGENLYVLVKNNPLQRVDFLGAAGFPPPWWAPLTGSFAGCTIAFSGSNYIKACCADKNCKEPCLDCCKTRTTLVSIPFGIAASINPICAIIGAMKIADASRACEECCSQKKSESPPECCKES